MTFRIHYTIGEYEDSFEVTGNTINDIKEKASLFFSERNLDAAECSPWSEEIIELARTTK